MRLFTARPSCQVLSPDSDDERSSKISEATGKSIARLFACAFFVRLLIELRRPTSKQTHVHQICRGNNLQRRRGIILSTFRFSWIWGGSFEVRLALDGHACRLSRPSRAGEDLLGAQGFERTDELCGRGVAVSRRRFAARHFFWARAFSIRSRSKSDRSHHEHGGSPE